MIGGCRARAACLTAQRGVRPQARCDDTQLIIRPLTAPPSLFPHRAAVDLRRPTRVGRQRLADRRRRPDRRQGCKGHEDEELRADEQRLSRRQLSAGLLGLA